MKRMLVVAGVVVLALLVGVVVVTRPDGRSEEALRSIGQPGVCSDVVDVPPSGASDHRNGDIQYAQHPPSSGPHAPGWLTVRKRRYTVEDEVPVEQVVHNLEHGYVVVWYAPTAPDVARLDEALAAAKARKLFAVPWTRTTLPSRYVLAAWGHTQTCNGVSGEAIADFLANHGGKDGDAPEPDGP